jgi:hypothetical protein
MVSQAPTTKAASQLSCTSKASQFPKASPTKAKKRLKYKVLTNKVKTYYLILQKTCHKIQGIDKQSKNILSDSTKNLPQNTRYRLTKLKIPSDSINY